ncbi:PLP-dependent aminotransferase family protein [Brassicibacter mesophilus]|uniref:MocR-like pyridoxine biosynthesis transcription factor PdxR n=1 Tax=Brassicibacter mesophilus TaxID=745119 RepID=UPI003D223650
MSSFEDIHLDKNDEQYLYMQLYEKMKSMIEYRAIEPHTKLPTIRYLANTLGINNVTVVTAYNLLEKEGYIYKKIGSGSYVQDVECKKINCEIFDEEINLSSENNYETDIGNDKEEVINFGSIAPTSDLFPVDDFKNALNEILDRDKGRAFAYQEGQGYYPLRSSIKKYIENYEVIVDEDSIQIISGAQQGIDILSKALIDYGDIVFTESPTYNGAIAVFKSRSAKIVEIPIQPDGIDIKELENKLRSFKPKFIYVMPNYQNPTGYSYSEYKKNKLIELANKHDFYIIEDDYLSDLMYPNNKNCILKSLDSEDRVIYIKSFSKIFMPGLRLAFMIIPRSIYSEVLSAKHISDISTSGIIQRAFELYLTKGSWQRHINYVNSIYMRRYNIMIDSIKKYMPKEISYSMPKGGLNFWLALPNGYSANELYNVCLKNKITIAPGSIFDSSRKDNQFFRLSIASVNEDNIKQGIRKLSQVISWFVTNYENKHISINMYDKFF